MQAIEGWQGRLQANGVNISMDAWKVRSTTTKVPGHDFESRYRKFKHGLKGSEVEFSGYVDLDNGPFADVGGSLRVGNTIACYCYLVKGALFYVFNHFDVFEVETANELDGRVSITVRGESNGVWLYPGGIVA